MKYLNLDLDKTLSKDSNTDLSSQKALKHYIDNKSVVLQFLQNSQPETFNAEDKWLNTANNKLFTAIDNNSFDNGESCSIGQLFTFNQLLFIFDGQNIKQFTSEYVLEQNNNDNFKFWIGTQEQYDAITEKDENTVYKIVDTSSDVAAILATQEEFNSSVSNKAATPAQVNEKFGNYLPLSGGNLDAGAVLRFTNENNQVTSINYDNNQNLNFSNNINLAGKLQTNSIVATSGNINKGSQSGSNVVWEDDIATASKLGVVKIGANLNIQADGTLSAAVSSTDVSNKVSKSGDTMTGPLLVSKNSVNPSIGITEVANGGYGDYNVCGSDGNRIGTIRISRSQDGNSNSLALCVHKPGTNDVPTTILNCAMRQDGSKTLAGITPSSTSNDTSVATTAWVIQKILELINTSSGIPVGSIMMGPVNSMTGYILCDGRAVSRTQYTTLFTAIGTNFGAGDGSTTFNVPDYRGCFLRMTGGSAGTMYQKQAQGLPDITGELDVEGGSLATGAFVNKGAYRQLHDGWKYNNVKIGFSAATSNSIYGAADEVRPVNFAVNYFIKY